MLKIKKIRIKKIGAFWERLPCCLTTRAFLSFLGFFLFFALLSGLIFYQYSFLASQTISKDLTDLLEFEEETLQNVLDRLETRQSLSQQVDLKKYTDPF